MKKVISFLGLLIVLLSVNVILAKSTIAEESCDYSSCPLDPTQRLTCLDNAKNNCQKLLNQARGQKTTLKSQLTYIDTQTKLTELKIDQTNTQIAKLEAEINDLSSRIVRLSQTVDSISQILLNRIVQTYKHGNYSAIDLIFSSNGFSDLLERVKYISVAQANDKKVLYQLQATKATYNDQKVDKETRQTQQQKLKKDLEKYQTQLSEQKSVKQKLLNAVQNDEAQYQSRLNDLAREISQIQQAARLLISTEPRKVAKGEVLGLMGNTGYSFGAHLHFGVYNISSLSQYNYYSNYEEPNQYLKSTSVAWWVAPDCNDNKGSFQTRSVGSGSWDWPMDTGNLRISQGFGDTCYTGELYGGRPHPAYDMYNNSNIVIKAVDEGQAYFCRNCSGGGNGVFIFHPNGKMTLYWHLQ